MFLSAREKYNFTDEEVITYIVRVRQSLNTLKQIKVKSSQKLSKFLARRKDELSAILGIREAEWVIAKGRQYSEEMAKTLENHRYVQIGKCVITSVILHILITCCVFNEDEQEAMVKIKEAINKFDPLPDLAPTNPSGTVDDEHKKAADQLTHDEIKKIEAYLGVRTLETFPDLQKEIAHNAFEESGATQTDLENQGNLFYDLIERFLNFKQTIDEEKAFMLENYYKYASDNPRLQTLIKLDRAIFGSDGFFFPKFSENPTLQKIEKANSQTNANDNDAPSDNSVCPSTDNPPEEKTLASRWMTEPYQRMSDDTLVKLLTQKIWPKLSEEVDGLHWTPAKRALPTFQKTKNMLAACILFHALELAKIAKLPKQEDDEVSDVDYMSAEDRAQAGISATSNRNAGIVHTKKKYNDTLPVGYMEVLEKFIPKEELPGRTTSRTYLKLVNKWVKMKLESVRDNIDSEASAKLFIAECKSDLGPQFYLYQDNRVKMKALLKEWKDQLPDIFNVPI